MEEYFDHRQFTVIYRSKISTVNNLVKYVYASNLPIESLIFNYLESKGKL